MTKHNNQILQPIHNVGTHVVTGAVTKTVRRSRAPQETFWSARTSQIIREDMVFNISGLARGGAAR